MEGLIYLLCAATALVCSALLLRAYWRGRIPFLLGCGLCFLALAVENVILFLDVVVVPETDLSSLYLATGLTGILLLLYSLIWEVK